MWLSYGLCESFRGHFQLSCRCWGAAVEWIHPGTCACVRHVQPSPLRSLVWRQCLVCGRQRESSQFHCHPGELPDHPGSNMWLNKGSFKWSPALNDHLLDPTLTAELRYCQLWNAVILRRSCGAGLEAPVGGDQTPSSSFSITLLCWVMLKEKLHPKGWILRMNLSQNKCISYVFTKLLKLNLTDFLEKIWNSLVLIWSVGFYHHVLCCKLMQKLTWQINV